MSVTHSPSQDQPYGVALTCRAWGIPRSTYYDALTRRRAGRERLKPGPRPAMDDAQLASLISEILAETEEQYGIRGEGYRKVHARLRYRGHRVAKDRVLRVMRERGLLSPTRVGRARGPRVHDGTIVTDRPDVMWGTDATSSLTLEGGNATVFFVVDHCTGECLRIHPRGSPRKRPVTLAADQHRVWPVKDLRQPLQFFTGRIPCDPNWPDRGDPRGHAAAIGKRFEALEPVRQAVRRCYGDVEKGIAHGLALRHDNGSQYIRRVFQRGIAFLGIESSPSVVRAPEGNGVAERLVRTLKEQLLWLRYFRTVEELRIALIDFAERYNASWLRARHGYLTPTQVRAKLAA